MGKVTLSLQICLPHPYSASNKTIEAKRRQPASNGSDSKGKVLNQPVGWEYSILLTRQSINLFAQHTRHCNPVWTCLSRPDACHSQKSTCHGVRASGLVSRNSPCYSELHCLCPLCLCCLERLSQPPSTSMPHLRLGLQISSSAKPFLTLSKQNYLLWPPGSHRIPFLPPW